MIWLSPPPLPRLSHQQAVSISQSSFVSTVRAYWREMGWGIDKSYNDEKARSAINHSILSGEHPLSEQIKNEKTIFSAFSRSRGGIYRNLFRRQCGCFANCSLNSGPPWSDLERILHLADPEVEFTDFFWQKSRHFCKLVHNCTVADFLEHYLNVLVVPCNGTSCSQTLETTDSLNTPHPDTDLNVLVVPCNGEELLTDPGDHGLPVHSSPWYWPECSCCPLQWGRAAHRPWRPLTPCTLLTLILTWMFLLSPAMGKSCSQTLETTDSLYRHRNSLPWYWPERCPSVRYSIARIFLIFTP